MNWGDFKTQVLRTNLLDPQGQTWSAENVFDAYGDALRTFVAHTAKPVVETFTTDGESGTFALAHEPYEDLEVVGEVYLGSGAQRSDYFPGGNNEEQAQLFYTYSPQVLELAPVPAAGKTLTVRYYGYWNVPEAADDDTFELDVPNWAISPLKKLVASLCYEGQAVQIATVVQWEDAVARNPWREQAKFMLHQYEQELARHQRQNRLRKARRHE